MFKLKTKFMKKFKNKFLTINTIMWSDNGLLLVFKFSLLTLWRKGHIFIEEI